MLPVRKHPSANPVSAIANLGPYLPAGVTLTAVIGTPSFLSAYGDGAMSLANARVNTGVVTPAGHVAIPAFTGIVFDLTGGTDGVDYIIEVAFTRSDGVYDTKDLPVQCTKNA